MIQLQQYIKQYFGISEDHLASIAEMFTKEHLSKHDYYLQEGHYCNKMSFIIDGHLRIFHVMEDGREVTQWISTMGDFVTDLAGLQFNAKVKKNIQALSDVQLLTIHRENYERIGSVVPNWDKLEKLFLAKCFMTLEDRVFSFLSMNSKARYDQLFSYKPSLFNEVPLQYLASMLGMSPETLSRIRSSNI